MKVVGLGRENGRLWVYLVHRLEWYLVTLRNPVHVWSRRKLERRIVQGNDA